MCMTAEQFMAFLALIGVEMIQTSPEERIVRADAGDVIWTLAGEAWCTDGPSAENYFDAAAPPKKG